MLKAAALGVVLQPHIVLYCLHLYLCLFVCVTYLVLCCIAMLYCIILSSIYLTALAVRNL
ncbi:hypothetical protein T4A_7340 [Trichinella pseudospiralis]|uniref:Uncharacterized protein n=1 Tax=Trichinella pseudospiralis TaxID=6337 RepID=A0A0V1ERR0_TRIPS|nr:hypothetical protein T4A_7340 [Trichinella pseudospiralis]